MKWNLAVILHSAFTTVAFSELHAAPSHKLLHCSMPPWPENGQKATGHGTWPDSTSRSSAEGGARLGCDGSEEWGSGSERQPSGAVVGGLEKKGRQPASSRSASGSWERGPGPGPGENPLFHAKLLASARHRLCAPFSCVLVFPCFCSASVCPGPQRHRLREAHEYERLLIICIIIQYLTTVGPRSLGLPGLCQALSGPCRGGP